MNSVASILLREFCSYDRAIAYASRIARSAALNGNGEMANEYAEAASEMAEMRDDRRAYWFKRLNDSDAEAAAQRIGA